MHCDRNSSASIFGKHEALGLEKAGRQVGTRAGSEAESTKWYRAGVPEGRTALAMVTSNSSHTSTAVFFHSTQKETQAST